MLSKHEEGAIKAFIQWLEDEGKDHDLKALREDLQEYVKAENEG